VLLAARADRSCIRNTVLILRRCNCFFKTKYRHWCPWVFPASAWDIIEYILIMWQCRKEKLPGKRLVINNCLLLTFLGVADNHKAGSKMIKTLWGHYLSRSFLSLYLEQRTKTLEKDSSIIQKDPTCSLRQSRSRETVIHVVGTDACERPNKLWKSENCGQQRDRERVAYTSEIVVEGGMITHVPFPIINTSKDNELKTMQY
jgi:hypothetical protein